MEEERLFKGKLISFTNYINLECSRWGQYIFVSVCQVWEGNVGDQTRGFDVLHKSPTIIALHSRLASDALF